jgi:hypothetical protein
MIEIDFHIKYAKIITLKVISTDVSISLSFCCVKESKSEVCNVLC